MRGILSQTGPCLYQFTSDSGTSLRRDRPSGRTRGIPSSHVEVCGLLGWPERKKPPKHFTGANGLINALVIEPFGTRPTFKPVDHVKLHRRYGAPWQRVCKPKKIKAL
jgi:hypothetical protein